MNAVTIFQLNFPEIVDLTLPAEGVFHNLVFVSIKKTFAFTAASNVRLRILLWRDNHWSIHP